MSDSYGQEDGEHSAENLVEVSTSQLQIGMFVAELDKPWLETPFLVQGFEIRSKSQIQTLMQHCKNVFIVGGGAARVAFEKVQAPPPKLATASSKIKSSGVTINRGGAKNKNSGGKVSALRRMAARPEYEPKRSVRAEHKVAREVSDAGKVNIKAIMHSVQMGQMIDTDVAEDTVSGCVQSIMNNPDAMSWMSKIKDENQYTAEHCLNVCILAIAFGRHLRLTQPELQLVGLCGLLHDVGKMKAPQEILDKPGKLTEEEFKIIQQHTVDGHRLLTDTVSDVVHSLAIDVALNHHERPDGKGYPRGLEVGISEFARIIAVVDAYDAITSNRCYSRAKSPVQAQKIIFENRGKQFDEEIALEFIKAIGPYPPGTIVELRNGMVGIVLTGKHKFRHLPTIVVLRDANKEPMSERTVELHLTDTNELSKDFLIKKTLTDGDCGIYLKDYKVKSEAAMF